MSELYEFRFDFLLLFLYKVHTYIIMLIVSRKLLTIAVATDFPIFVILFDLKRLL